MGIEHAGSGLRVTPGGFAWPNTSLDNHTRSWRLERPLYETVPAPCHGACPALEEIPVYLSHLALGRLREAWEALVLANPLPAVTGRVCPHPCESSCHRGSYDSALSIHSAERFLGDTALREGWDYPGLPGERREESVAVVGAGPAGLSCAYHLRRQGYRVTLFEALPEAGGTCRVIPDYRLPSEIISREVERLLGVGIDFRPETRLGRDISLEELESGFSAVYLAPGRQKNRPYSVDHAVPADLRHGLDLLREFRNVGSLPRWERVVIAGGGNTAVDLARTLLRTGSREVHIVTDEELPGAEGESGRGIMPAIGREVAMALEEGVRIHTGRRIRRLLLRNDRVVGCELVHALKEFEQQGPVHRAFSGTETILEVEAVIPAVGQEVDPEGIGRLFHDRSVLSILPTGQVEGEGRIFAGGDAAPGGGLVSQAVGSGHRGARMIDAMLRKKEFPVAAPPSPIPFSGLNMAYFDHRSAYRPEELSPEVRTGFSEIERTAPLDLIRQEADRCFSCGHCLECDNCWTLCPDGAVLRTAGISALPVPYVFDYDYCKGCGLCVRECPSGHIRMVPEE
ncbi:MAG: FAD-dependent oxidoreductase [Nitrospirae bacterium]|nr:FAD-dependent oxidoreductase [Nitrospirota bacterium]